MFALLYLLTCALACMLLISTEIVTSILKPRAAQRDNNNYIDCGIQQSYETNRVFIKLYCCIILNFWSFSSACY